MTIISHNKSGFKGGLMNVTQIEKSCTQHQLPSYSVNTFLSQLMQWRQNYRTRRQLRDLPPHLWKDLGLEREQIEAEVNKSFWR